MGDFYNNVVMFLEDYYVYVIGVGAIIILMLIGFLASRRKARKAVKEENTMANINDIKTGNITDVTSGLQSNEIKPVDIAPVSEVNNTPGLNNGEVNPSIPVATQAASTSDTAPVVESNSAVSPVNPTDNHFEIRPTVEAPNPVEEAKPVDDDRFDKTEVIDFSTMDTPTPSKNENVTPFVIDNSQYDTNDSILNGENTTFNNQDANK